MAGKRLPLTPTLTLTLTLTGKMPAFFLDYDGTLTPIVDNPYEARPACCMLHSAHPSRPLPPSHPSHSVHTFTHTFTHLTPLTPRTPL